MAKAPTVPTQSPATLQETYARWQVRHANAVKAGLDPTPVNSLYQQDWAKVAAGGTPMTAEEVSASLNAAYGHPQVAKGRPTGLFGTLENVVPDIAGTLWNVLPGLVKTAYHLPSEAKATAEYAAHATDNEWLQAHGYEPFSGDLLSHIAETTRNFARTPLLPLAVPGLSTAAGLTTSAGREGLQRHPVGTLLDVAPFAGALASAGVLGAGAREAIEAGGIAEQADKLVKGGRLDLADQLAQAHGFQGYDELSRASTGAQRAAAALAEGRPVKALVRAIPQLSSARLELLDRFGLTPRAQGARRVVAAGQTAMARELDQHARDHLSPLVESGMSEEDVVRIGKLAGRPDLWPAATPEDQAVLTKLQSYVDGRTAADVAENPNHLYRATLSNGKTVIYGGTQAVKFQALQATLDRSFGTMTAAEDEAAKLTAQLEDAQRALDTANQMVQKSKRIGRNISGQVHDPGQAVLGITQATMIQRQADKAAREVAKLMKRVNDAKAKVAEATDKAHQADQRMQRNLARTVPAQYRPMIESQIRTKVQAWLAGQHTSAQDPHFIDAMKAFDRGQPLANYLPKTVLNQITKEVTEHWQEVAEKYNPIWVPSMSAEDLERGIKAPRLSGKPKTPSSWKASYINRSAGSSNFALALGQDYADKLAYEANQKLTEDFIRPQARTTSYIDQEMSAEVDRFVKDHPSYSEAEAQNVVRRRAWAPLDENLGLGDQASFQKLYKEQLWVPRDVADAIRKSMAPPTDNELRKLNMGSIRLYKHAVMDFSPTHKAHIWLGSMLPLMLGSGVEEFNPHRVLEAWHMARNAARGSMPDLLNQHLALTAADDLMDYQHGNMLGRLVHSKLGNMAEMSRHLDEMGANMYRSWAYLAEEARGLKAGLSKEEADARGIAYANKVFVDVNNLSPVEQALAKNVFPFYSYTRWALGFVMQYPIDHPVRASILAHLGEQEKAYNDQKGIPNTLSMLFSLGKPNSKGDQWGIQYRAFNPFRDTASAFTLAGIFRNLGPAGRVLATAGGINTLSGTPDPYPGLDVDPNTGSLVGTVRGRSPLSAAEQVVPQLSLVDHYLGLSQQARSLRTSDPQAFRRQVFSILNMPFVPQSYTPYTAAGTRARDQLRVAQAAVSAAVKNQDLGALDIYPQVPVPAKLRPYFGNQQYVATPTFKRVVGLIYQWEKRTGQKVT